MNEIANPQNMIRGYGTEFHGLHYEEFVFAGIRGVTVSNGILNFNDNKIDEWNDTLAIFGPGGYFAFYLATIDPGKFFADNPMNPGGTARITPQLAYHVRGLHYGKPAFRQEGVILTQRDSNGNYNWNEEKVVTDASGINIHAAHNILNVGRDSAGCIVPKLLWENPLWTNDIVDKLYLSPQKRFPTMILDNDEFSRWIGTQNWS
ncbi:MAG: hypothetical protein OEY34_04180 [Cyclobacteriaceae bacterium]|nr:hypothetical protein [Cyclobacteriaceae bacterium]